MGFRYTTCSSHSKLHYSFPVCWKLFELKESGYFEMQLQYILVTSVFVWDVLTFQGQNVLQIYAIISYLLRVFQFLQADILARI